MYACIYLSIDLPIYVCIYVCMYDYMVIVSVCVCALYPKTAMVQNGVQANVTSAFKPTRSKQAGTFTIER